MFTGEGIIGRAIEFVITKIANKKIDLAMDDRRRICRAFTELYFCVEKIEDATDLLLRDLGSAINEGNAIDLINQVFTQNAVLKGTSARLLELGSELRRAIDLYDPALAATMASIFSYKYSFLQFIENSVCLKSESRNSVLEYKEPEQKVLEIDLEEVYRWASENPERDEWPEHFSWPTGLLLNYEFDSVYRYKTIAVSDPKALAKLRDIVQQHLEALSKARKAIREFIVSQFTIEEVLYVSKGMERSKWF